MSKRSQVVVAAVILAVLFSFPAFAADYSAYPTEELAAMRGTMSSASEEERQAFRDEWQRRITSMPVDERRQYVGRPANASGNDQGYKYGSASGSESQNRLGNRKRKGQGYGRRKK